MFQRHGSHTAIAALASPGPIAAAASCPVVPRANVRRLPSGSVIVTACSPTAGSVTAVVMAAPFWHGRGWVAGRKMWRCSGGVKRRGAPVLDQITEALGGWEGFAEEAGVHPNRVRFIASEFRRF